MNSYLSCQKLIRVSVKFLCSRPKKIPIDFSKCELDADEPKPEIGGMNMPFDMETLAKLQENMKMDPSMAGMGADGDDDDEIPDFKDDEDSDDKPADGEEKSEDKKE